MKEKGERDFNSALKYSRLEGIKSNVLKQGRFSYAEDTKYFSMGSCAILVLLFIMRL